MSPLFINLKMFFSRSKKLLTSYYSYGTTKCKIKKYSSCAPRLKPEFMCLSSNFSDEEIQQNLFSSMTVLDDFVNENEEKSLQDEFEPFMKKKRYEADHWDDAIHGYRETERLNWNESNTKIIDRVRNVAFPKGVAPIKYVHVLDLQENGVIKPHVDSVRFCGTTIAGLSLLTDSVMRLVHTDKSDFYVDVLLKRRSLYIMKDSARYDYTHEILGNEFSKFNNLVIKKYRRVSVICRNEPV